eukprot:1286548-Pleurochrysis_carterae.AAC.2
MVHSADSPFSSYAIRSSLRPAIQDPLEPVPVHALKRAGRVSCAQTCALGRPPLPLRARDAGGGAAAGRYDRPVRCCCGRVA